MTSFSIISRNSVPAILLALVSPSLGHSWIEYASKIAPNGTFVGSVGYPRGYIPRTSTNPLWSDSIPELLLPITGQSAYSGDEIINKYTYEAAPAYPMLEAAPGDYIALFHYENGHVTLPQNQPFKPRNRGTIFLYGTSKPAEHEKLFDVHLLWNTDGTGGDGRGKLLATRNYDDGQCFQPNNGPLSEGRASNLSDIGANHDRELICQSDLRLPNDLKDGSVYTIYWYWDWPDLDPDHIDLEATTNGKYPWAGTFMRGQKDPNGFTMLAISKNESYASSIDIKITAGGAGAQGLSFKDKAFTGSQWIGDQNIYSKAVENQMHNNYQVAVDADAPPSQPGQGHNSMADPGDDCGGPTHTGGSGGGGATVTVTQLIPATTVIKTVYVTAPVDSIPPAESTPSDVMTPTSTSTYIVTVTIPLGDAQPSSPPTTTAPPPTAPSATAPSATTPSSIATESEPTAASEGRPVVSPFIARRRADWHFGRH